VSSIVVRPITEDDVPGAAAALVEVHATDGYPVEGERLRLVLDVMTKDTAAIRLYERLSWQHFGEVAHHFGAGEQFPAVCYVWPAT
jgi:hypothetical protein